jgi:TRAP-type uncharacterized transport system substrate-binding protein
MMIGAVSRGFASRVAVAATLMIACCTAVAAETLADLTNRGLVVVMTGGADGASVAMAEDLGRLLNDGATRRLVTLVGHGAIQDLIDLRAMRGLDLGIVQADVLDYVKQQNLSPAIENTITYVARLHGDELHLLARADVDDIQHLAGKKVELCGSAAVTAASVFDLLHVVVEPSFDEEAVALRKLAAGEVSAVAYVAPKPTPLFMALGDHGFRFLPIPLTPEIALRYAPAQLTVEDYPRLVAADAPVDTVAVGMVLFVANLPADTERYRTVAAVVESFFTKLAQLQEAPHHPKWTEVNIAAELAGWKRFPPAAAWLKRNAPVAAASASEKELHEAFAKFLDERNRPAGGGVFSLQEKDQLFDRLERLQGRQPH